MPQYYIYLISSLPVLEFGAAPPFSWSEFLKICTGKIPEADLALLEKASTNTESHPVAAMSATFSRWRLFDTALRNELVKIRSARKHIDPEKYLRHNGYADPLIAHIAMNAYRMSSVLEAEKMLDQARWQFLEELGLGHYFDLDYLLLYAQKLFILERWQKIRSSDGQALLDRALS
ncbi:MAG: DUF2764 family protein [Candidatus Omnitrophica bacterium]|nr:DUF2764 family protein [Candidatus Omnitrophota bacterium]